MSNKIQALVLALLMLAMGCSGGSSGFRTYGEDTSADPNGSNVADSSNRPRDEGVSPDDYTTGAIPNPLTGSNLVEVLVSANCVGIPGESMPSCKEVRLSAKIEVNKGKAIRFAAASVGSLGIKRSSWEFKELPKNTECLSSGSGFEFNPICTVSSGSLLESKIKATLSIVSDDGSVFQGLSPDSTPTTGNVFGNFMRLDSSAGLAPSGAKYHPYAVPFSQIWQELVSGLYLTNILNEGNGGLIWADADTLCRNKVNSGDGVGKWRLPTIVEMCGENYDGGSCTGGLQKVNIDKVVFDGGGWQYNYWSSTSLSSGSAWLANFKMSHADSSGITDGEGVICVR